MPTVPGILSWKPQEASCDSLWQCGERHLYFGARQNLVKFQVLAKLGIGAPKWTSSRRIIAVYASCAGISVPGSPKKPGGRPQRRPMAMWRTRAAGPHVYFRAKPRTKSLGLEPKIDRIIAVYAGCGGNTVPGTPKKHPATSYGNVENPDGRSPPLL